MNAQPNHGDYGERHTVIRTSETACTRVWSNARWCATCREWVYATGVVSLVLGSVCCPKCKTDWERTRPAPMPAGGKGGRRA